VTPEQVAARFEGLRLEVDGRILGLPAGVAAAAVRMESVVPLEAGWMFRIGGTALPATDLLVEDVARAGRFLARTERLALSVSGSADAPLVRRLVEALARRLRAATPEQLRAHLQDRPLGIAEAEAAAEGAAMDDTPAPEPDPGAGTRGDDAGAAAGADAAGPGPCGGVNRCWNHPRGWSRFFADEELVVQADALLVFPGHSLRVEHGDLECQFLWRAGSSRARGSRSGR